MRVLGVDFGRRRIGLALSDPTGTLARPWKTIGAGHTPRASATEVAALVNSRQDGRADDQSDLEPIQAIVVGVPRRLNGEDDEQTQPARAFAHALQELTRLVVHLQDERLTSYEAERRLAELERDWRRRKAKLDAVSAAIILQDFLDARAPASSPHSPSAVAEPDPE
jgi:putative pre-16S rRNA nuclease